MSYGLYDGDWTLYGKSPFNLEIMKLANYYRSKRQLVGITLNFNPDLYTTLIYRKDYQDNIYEKNLSKYNNVECGGLSFTAGQYSPMQIEKELTPPDPTIYNKLIKGIALSNAEKDDFQSLMNACHFRISLDNKTVWEDYMKPLDFSLTTRLFYAHDPCLGQIENAPAAILRILESSESKYNKYFGCKFPIIIEDFNLLKEWLEVPLHRFTTIIYNGFLNPEQIVELAEYPQTQLDRIQYNVAYGITSTQDFVDNRLQQAFRSVAYLRKYRKKILLIYNTQYLVEKEWNLFFRLLNGYSNTSKLRKEDYDIILKYDSFFSFIKKISKQKIYVHNNYGTPEEMRELFVFISNINYEVFNDFYNCHTVHLKDGRFENDEQTE